MLTGSKCSSFLMICLILWKPVHSVHCFCFVSCLFFRGTVVAGFGGEGCAPTWRGFAWNPRAVVRSCDVEPSFWGRRDDAATQHRCPDVSDLAQRLFFSPHTSSVTSVQPPCVSPLGPFGLVRAEPLWVCFYTHKDFFLAWLYE